MATSIRAIDSSSIHRITSGQVVIDLQTAVKELVENSLDGGATNIEVKFKEYGLKSVEVVDNGSGIAEEDYDSIALNHHTSKLSSLSSLTTLTSFGFRGEALSSLCALCESVVVVTATDNAGQKGVGMKLEMGRRGDVVKKSVAARQRGTTIILTNLFAPLPVRRKEFERNAKREFGKAVGLLTGYALVPCASTTNGNNGNTKGVRLTTTNTLVAGKKQTNVLSPGSGSSTLATAQVLWGSKALESVTEFELSFSVEGPKPRLSASNSSVSAKAKEIKVEIRGLISKFAIGCGRTGTDRQFFYVNGRPCALGKVQKAFNEVYKSFNVNQSPFVIADLIVPGDAVDINVSPDKRTLFLHSEDKLIVELKAALEETFSASRSTYAVGQSLQAPAQPLKQTLKQTLLSINSSPGSNTGSIDSHARNQSNKAKNNYRDDEDAGTLEVPTEVKDVPTLKSRHDSNRGRSVDKPRLASEIQQGPKTDEAVSATAQVDLPTEDGPPIGPLNNRLSITITPPPSKAMLPKHVTLSHVEVDETESYSETIQSSFDGDSQVSGSSDIPQTRTADTSFASESSNTPHGSEREVSTGGSFPRAPSVPICRPGISNSAATRQSVQMVLSTAGASWNLRRDDGNEPPRKKSRVSSEAEDALQVEVPGRGKGKEGTAARQILRDRLSLFARSGSQVVNDDLNDVEDGGDPDEIDELQEDEGELDNIGKKRKNRASHHKGDDDGMALDERPAEVIQDRPKVPKALDEDAQTRSVDASRITRAEMSEVVDLTDDTGYDGSGDISMRDPDQPVSNIQIQESGKNAAHPEIVRSTDGETISMRFDLSRVAEIWRQFRDKLASISLLDEGSSTSKPSFGQDAGVSNAEDGAKAADALSRVIDKDDFGSMEIIGQFNLGFIVTRRQKYIDQSGGMDDLFIVDQHAADEKYNFETIQQTTQIESQKLFRPQPLELTAADELQAMENIEVLRQNGFEIDVTEDAGSELGQRLQLVAQPVSKSTNFDMKDLEELLHLMQDRPTGQMVRCSKARAMFAMRACRKSVMVGMPLTKNQMTSVVQHMGTMDQPWNCPHGRPTMRHLSDIANIGQGRTNIIDWAVYAPLQ